MTVNFKKISDCDLGVTYDSKAIDIISNKGGKHGTVIDISKRELQSIIIKQTLKGKVL